jgi:glycosyltransferase involved in cell wall biosynthesis
MLSICVPVYNFDITNLAFDLKNQADSSGIEYEIILVDDCSDIKFKEINRKVIGLKNVNYEEQAKNLGRSTIRNYLANKAKYENLLFIDCDAKIVNPSFITNYVQVIGEQRVIIGGVAYDTVQPSGEFLFRWKYGHSRESISADERSKNPYNSFKTFNFLISKKLFQLIKFDESLNGYGHEDTLFGYQLQKLKIEILHINNPLIHLGLETNQLFLLKTENGLHNLKKLFIQKQYENNFVQSIKLLKYYKKISPAGRKLLSVLFLVLQPLLKRNLFGKNPNMKLFDFYKLGFLCSIK